MGGERKGLPVMINRLTTYSVSCGGDGGGVPISGGRSGDDISLFWCLWCSSAGGAIEV